MTSLTAIHTARDALTRAMSVTASAYGGSFARQLAVSIQQTPIARLADEARRLSDELYQRPAEGLAQQSSDWAMVLSIFATGIETGDASRALSMADGMAAGDRGLVLAAWAARMRY